MKQTAALLTPAPKLTPMAWTAGELVRKIAKPICPQTDPFRSFNCSPHKKAVAP